MSRVRKGQAENAPSSRARGARTAVDLRLPLDRLCAFSDGAFAVIITLLVLELRPPQDIHLKALLGLWPAMLSYAVSYLFIAIVWINHHHLLRYAESATPPLWWSNFGHLFSVSFIPFATAWLAQSRLASGPVAAYAAVFFLVNASYIALCVETIDRSPVLEIKRLGPSMRSRAIATLVLFALAGVTALWFPIIGMALISLCLILYLRPDARSRPRRAS